MPDKRIYISKLWNLLKYCFCSKATELPQLGPMNKTPTYSKVSPMLFEKNNYTEYWMRE